METEIVNLPDNVCRSSTWKSQGDEKYLFLDYLITICCQKYIL